MNRPTVIETVTNALKLIKPEDMLKSESKEIVSGNFRGKQYQFRHFGTNLCIDDPEDEDGHVVHTTVVIRVIPCKHKDRFDADDATFTIIEKEDTNE